MTLYVSILLVFFTLDVVSKLAKLAIGGITAPKPEVLAVDVFLTMGLIAWGLVLLF